MCFLFLGLLYVESYDSQAVPDKHLPCRYLHDLWVQSWLAISDRA